MSQFYRFNGMHSFLIFLLISLLGMKRWWISSFYFTNEKKWGVRRWYHICQTKHVVNTVKQATNRNKCSEYYLPCSLTRFLCRRVHMRLSSFRIRLHSLSVKLPWCLLMVTWTGKPLSSTIFVSLSTTFQGPTWPPGRDLLVPDSSWSYSRWVSRTQKAGE